jgi:hypothetical protein
VRVCVCVLCGAYSSSRSRSCDARSFIHIPMPTQNQELRGNIRTFVRVRPSKEDGSEGACPVSIECDGSGGEPGRMATTHNGKAEVFKFDRCFGAGSSQEEVFGEVQHFVQSSLDGHNVSLLAYGQTGAGERFGFQVSGLLEVWGLNPRA